MSTGVLLEKGSEIGCFTTSSFDFSSNSTSQALSRPALKNVVFSPHFVQ